MTHYRFTDARYTTSLQLADLLHNLAYEITNAPGGTEYRSLTIEDAGGSDWRVKVSTSVQIIPVSVDDNGIAHSTEGNAAAWDDLPDMDAVPF